MDRNVEIKAHVRNYDEILRLASELTGKEPTILKQHDVFYNATSGRLKMRSVEEDNVIRTELIWYDRPDVAGPKECKFHKFEVPANVVEALDACLRCSMGVKGEVKKVRTLFIHDRTRIHIDRVEGLGDYMELEVCLSECESALQGEKVTKEIMEELHVSEKDLLEGAYMDMLTSQQ